MCIMINNLVLFSFDVSFFVLQPRVCVTPSHRSGFDVPLVLLCFFTSVWKGRTWETARVFLEKHRGCLLVCKSI